MVGIPACYLSLPEGRGLEFESMVKVRSYLSGLYQYRTRRCRKFQKAKYLLIYIYIYAHIYIYNIQTITRMCIVKS